MRIVLDTNVFISSFLSRTGPPGKIIDLWKTGDLTLCLSAETIEEYILVLERFGLEGQKEIEDLLQLFRSRRNILFAVPEAAIQVIDDDPDDNKFIECAVAAGAEFIISGNNHLLALKQYGMVDITSPTEFLNHLGHRR